MYGIVKENATGAAAIAASLTVPAGNIYQLVAVSVHLDAAPTTAEDLTVTLNSAAGAEYDVLLYILDPSIASVTDIFWQADNPVYLGAGDAIDVAYTNTDTGTYGVQIVARRV